MFSGIGLTEMIVLGVVAVLLFGSRLPEVAKNVGRSYGEFRRGLNNLQSTIREENVVEYLKHEESGFDCPEDQDRDRDEVPPVEPSDVTAANSIAVDASDDDARSDEASQ